MNMQTKSNISTDNASFSAPSDLLKKGREFLASGNHKDSLAYLLEAFLLAPENKDIQTAFIDILACTSGYKLPSNIVDQLAAIALTNGHDIQKLATVLANQFATDPEVTATIEYFENAVVGEAHDHMPVTALQNVLGNPLLMLISTKAISISPVVERLITALRRYFLLEWTTNNVETTVLVNTCPELLSLIAGQCFNTEYIFEVSREEDIRAGELYSKIMNDVQAADPMDLALVGCYKSLWSVLIGQEFEDLELLISKANEWPEWFQIIWRAQFVAPYQEAGLKQNIEAYTPINEGLSAQMAEQYEAFPYPRWHTTTRNPAALALKEVMSAKFPQQNNDDLEAGPTNMLVAGCGTGEQIVKLTGAIATNNVLAIDLSMSSLAYAQRKTHEFGINNVHFGQADILHLSELGASFDTIVCTGVLHHMETPEDGLKALKSVSKENSRYYFGLYSERARRHVSAARILVDENNIPDTIEGLREFRALIRSLPAEHPATAIADSRDFYSASGLHDYIFNVHELRYTPAGLKSLLEKNGFEFLGFELSRPELATLYGNRFPSDPDQTNLDNWEILDKETPGIFSGMMQFWCANKTD